MVSWFVKQALVNLASDLGGGGADPGAVVRHRLRAGVSHAFLISFFPIVVNVATGLATIEPELEASGLRRAPIAHDPDLATFAA